ncbi:uncharacterized protein BX663DRAFT_532465 [Cokeromyces recurvatus]|uniref:uncharacterized protein n=1 Tax=Cokeromyces recurvatus TaxID=90255 RepID=UPI00221E7846|nr:uncharacterized protein BX663DRAFT_532465 [Cokeromyces recurvatus]KAI7900366.1 hypothetical protein BX663DRAFT_532465 [Cokeromyces recurvatus]
MELLGAVKVDNEEIYNFLKNIYNGEPTFSSLFIYSCLIAVTRGVTLNDCLANFKPGEAHLESMSRQLNALDSRNNDKGEYKADGIIKLYRMKKIELLLLESSGSLNNKAKSKINYDHHNGIYGSLTMLKTVADIFCFASIECFKVFKIYFLQAEEENLEILRTFDDKHDHLPNLIQFWWRVKALVTESVKVISKLSEEHIVIEQTLDISIIPLIFYIC